MQTILSIFASILLLVTAAGTLELIYDPAVRTTAGYALVGLAAVGLVMMVVLLIISKPDAEG